jgi:hypothetical protein
MPVPQLGRGCGGDRPSLGLGIVGNGVLEVEHGAIRAGAGQLGQHVTPVPRREEQGTEAHGGERTGRAVGRVRVTPLG